MLTKIKKKIVGQSKKKKKKKQTKKTPTSCCLQDVHSQNEDMEKSHSMQMETKRESRGYLYLYQTKSTKLIK